MKIEKVLISLASSVIIVLLGIITYFVQHGIDRVETNITELQKSREAVDLFHLNIQNSVTNINKNISNIQSDVNELKTSKKTSEKRLENIERRFNRYYPIKDDH